MKKIISILTLCVLTTALFAADTVRYGTGSAIINSQSTWVTNTAVGLVTNGFYPPYIVGTNTCTNLVLLNPGGSLPGADKDIVIQFTAAATAATTTNVVFTLTATVGNPISITNAPATGWNGSAAPRGVFSTQTLALNGTTPVTTNVVFSPAVAPYFANGLNLYLETIQMGVAATACLTNYSVTVVQ
jgi:hypothetical protein